MAQDYDKIIKETIDAILLPIVQRELGLDIKSIEKITHKLQYTIEREPDILGLVRGKKEADDYILHMEYEVKGSIEKMVYRFLLYYGLLGWKHEKPIKQYLIYIGRQKQPNIRTTIKHENLEFSFTLLNFRDFDYEPYLQSSIPEEVIFAILCKFTEDEADKVVRSIVLRLKELVPDRLRLLQYAKQLEIISKLRDYQELTDKIYKDMALVYDIKTDIRYLQGQAEAQKEADRLLRKERAKAEKEKAEERAKAEKERKLKEHLEKQLKKLQKQVNQLLEAQTKNGTSSKLTTKTKKTKRVTKKQRILNLLKSSDMTLQQIAKSLETTIAYVKRVKKDIKSPKS